MASAPLRFCAHSGCSNRVPYGRCPAHRQAVHQKLSAHRRGYTARWERFRTVEYPSLLLDRGIIPACGARLHGTHSPHSYCAAQGIVNMTDLELDHEPPLTEAERQDSAAVLDPYRVAFLCKRDHTVKTNAERAVHGDVYGARHEPSAL